MKLACVVGWGAGVALLHFSPVRSLLALIGFLLFWGCSVVLLILLAGFLARRWKSGSVGKRVLIAGGAIAVVVFVVQRLIPPDNATQVRQTIETVMTSTNSSYCDEKVTERYLEQTTGEKPPFADNACKNNAGSARANSVSVDHIAIDDDQARAIVESQGGFFDGSSIAVRLAKEGGTWKLDQIIDFAKFDRAKFAQAFRARLLKFGSPASSVDCVLAKEHRFSDAEIENATLRDSRKFFTPIVVACDRPDVERKLRSAFEKPELRFPPQAIDCVERRLGTATDAELVRLELDLRSYGRLFLSCGRHAFLGYYRRELESDHDLDGDAVDCVIKTFRGLSSAKFVRLSYDEDRYDALIDDCD